MWTENNIQDGRSYKVNSIPNKTLVNFFLETEKPIAYLL